METSYMFFDKMEVGSNSIWCENPKVIVEIPKSLVLMAQTRLPSLAHRTSCVIVEVPYSFAKHFKKIK